MMTESQKAALEKLVHTAKHPQEQAINVMLALQDNMGYLSDEAVLIAAELLKIPPVKIEELATFYNYIYREPVGKYVIMVCDSVICWLNDSIKIRDYLRQKLKIDLGQTTPDGLFTLLPACCIGYCDHSPAILINKQVYGHLTPSKIDEILDKLSSGA
jgi:NADH-quinone oxidoreductase subunit E